MSVTVCAQSGRRLHGHMRVIEHATVELLGQWCSGRSNATPRWDAVSSGQRHESSYGRHVARPTPHSPQDLGQGYWAATATVRWNLVYCETNTPRCDQHHKNVNNITSLLVTLCAVSKLIGTFHTGNFCFCVPSFKQLLLRNRAVDFVEICMPLLTATGASREGRRC